MFCFQQGKCTLDYGGRKHRRPYSRASENSEAGVWAASTTTSWMWDSGLLISLLGLTSVSCAGKWGQEDPLVSGWGLNEICSSYLAKYPDNTEQENSGEKSGRGLWRRALESLVSPRRLTFIRVWKPAVAKKGTPMTEKALASCQRTCSRNLLRAERRNV